MNLETIAWIVGVGATVLVPASIGVAVKLITGVGKLVSMHEHPAKTGFGTEALEGLPTMGATLEKKLEETERTTRKIYTDIQDLKHSASRLSEMQMDIKQVIVDNTAAMNRVAAVIEAKL